MIKEGKIEMIYVYCTNYLSNYKVESYKGFNMKYTSKIWKY